MQLLNDDSSYVSADSCQAFSGGGFGFRLLRALFQWHRRLSARISQKPLRFLVVKNFIIDKEASESTQIKSLHINIAEARFGKNRSKRSRQKYDWMAEESKSKL